MSQLPQVDRCMICGEPADWTEMAGKDGVRYVGMTECNSDDCGLRFVLFIIPDDEGETAMKVMGHLLPLVPEETP